MPTAPTASARRSARPSRRRTPATTRRATSAPRRRRPSGRPTSGRRCDACTPHHRSTIVTTTTVKPTAAKQAGESLLQVTNLTKHFPIRRGLLQRVVGAVQAVDGLTFDVARGETLSLVGESGCGKTTTGRMLTRLLEPTAGTILLEGQDITHWSTGKMRPLRRDVQMIFQDPYGSLNPRHTVGTIVGAPDRLQGIKTEKGVKATVQELLELVGLNPEHYNRYPHEFSGGQRQRIGIARSLALKPKLIIADEPVSALDVSIQAQVINLLEDLQDEFGLTYVVIAHDLSVVRHMSDRVAVMYLGKLVEIAERDELYTRPMHPYTTALLSAVPIPDTQRRTKRERIRLEGDVPSPVNPPPACHFPENTDVPAPARAGAPLGDVVPDDAPRADATGAPLTPERDATDDGDGLRA